MSKKINTTETLVKNVRSLINETGISISDLSKKSGVSKRMINYILTKERTPSVDIVDAIARAFGISGWELLLPSFQFEIVKQGALTRLIQNYVTSSDDGRTYINHVAEKEATYSNKS